jgi:hypothetical protein
MNFGVIQKQKMADRILIATQMNSFKYLYRTIQSIALVTFALTVIGCKEKLDVKTQTSELEKAFPSAAAATPAPIEVAPAQAQAPDANAYVKAALSAVSSDDYAGGVIALQTAQKRGVTADQLMAIERAKQAMTASLVERAARGDERAKAELARIERTRSQ